MRLVGVFIGIVVVGGSCPYRRGMLMHCGGIVERVVQIAADRIVIGYLISIVFYRRTYECVDVTAQVSSGTCSSTPSSLQNAFLTPSTLCAVGYDRHGQASQGSIINVQPVLHQMTNSDCICTLRHATHCVQDGLRLTGR